MIFEARETDECDKMSWGERQHAVLVGVHIRLILTGIGGLTSAVVSFVCYAYYNIISAFIITCLSPVRLIFMSKLCR